MEKLFNESWSFQREGEGTWREVDIPHDWLIADTKNLYATGVGRYRKYTDFGPLGEGQRVLLCFDGVYMDAKLYINGREAGEWKHGYTAFRHDITPFVQPGRNEIVLTVQYESPNSRWYSGAGIYRDCFVMIKNAVHFVPDGVYVTPVREGDNWRVEISAEVTAGTDSTPMHAPVHMIIRHHLAGCENGDSVGENHFHVNAGSVVGTPVVFDTSININKPQLWDIENPHCYTLVSELYVNGELTDTVHTRFGFREIAFHPEAGFSLNGRRVNLNGVCQHHDLGGLGAAVHKDALRRQLTLLREMGVNAIRTAHNPPAAVFMELADEMGFIVQSEFTDMWKRSKTKYDYARFFEEWAARDVAAWVRRDRNCPSLVMWSIGNEISDTHADFEDGAATMRMLMDLVAQHDPKQHAPVTLCSNYMPWENTQRCADIIKLIGYNYAEYLYHDHHRKHPDWIIYGGETASTVQSRGIYHFPLSKPLLCDDDLQCSALGNSTTSWGAKSPEACIIDHRDAPFTFGQFLWTGTDYIGEPTPYHTKNSYFGQIDTAGFPKDSFYIYQSAWTPLDADNPVLHLFPHWDWNPGQPIDVRIASNAPQVELFLNGKSLGVKEIDHEKGVKLTADYIVPYEPGEIEAVAYDYAGHVIGEAVRRSFGDAVALRLEHKYFGELIFTEITAVDKDGNPVENANNRVRVTVTGGDLLALDNGDSTDYDLYQPPTPGTHSRHLFSGKLLAITKLRKQKEGASGGVTFVDYGNLPDITAEMDNTYIPVRKIELTRGEGFAFAAKIFPENATDKTLHWRLTDAGGIDSTLATLEHAEHRAQLVPKADGEVFIRCAAHNGKDHPDFISLLPVTLTGFGKPFLDPYHFLAGGLYNRSNTQMGNGNERGVATLRDGESHVGFADLVFGPHGSNEVTFWLFPMDPTPFDFDIFLGMPDAGRKLYTAHYDKGSKWNTYIPVTYTLPERLTGVQTLSLVFRRKVHIKGFQFTPPARAFAKIPFAAHDQIYGDAYTVCAETVEGIGNNVSITFEGMDFGGAAGEEKNATHMEIAWRSQRDNTVRMLFLPEDGTPEAINLLILPAQAHYAPAKIKLDTPLHSKGKIRFLFLPGTEIDLAWFALSCATQ
ncbi:MAG: DUF4982 domain-containing protein [Defluviitaleaceae bacterium]|nr:DUF4982 domain-containing protein [Defluviitaleaceae bacterium]MCL2239941.1 DUF4982 domain-containing protein [Defluviitaleaceae bacterium]